MRVGLERVDGCRDGQLSGREIFGDRNGDVARRGIHGGAGQIDLRPSRVEVGRAEFRDAVHIQRGRISARVDNLRAERGRCGSIRTQFDAVLGVELNREVAEEIERTCIRRVEHP